jgi:hypothetical protein
LSSRLSVLGNDDTALELSRLHLRVLDALLLAETDPSAARKARADLADAKLEGGWLDALDTRLSALDPTQRETGDEEARARRACNKLGLVDLRGWRAVLLTRSARRSLPFKKILDDLAAVKELRDLNSAELRARVLALRTRAAPKDAQALAETLARLSASPRGLTWPFVVEHLEQLLAGGREDEALAWILKTSGGPKPVTGRPRGRADFNWAKPVRRWLGSLPRGHQADAPSEPFAASTLQALEGGFAAHFGPRWRTEHYDPNAEAQTLNKRYRELLDNDAVRRRLIALARIAVIFGSPLDPIFCRPLMDPIHSLNEEDWKSRTPDGPIQAALELTKLGGEVCDPNDVAALRALLTGALVFRDKPEQRQLIPILRQYARIQPDLFERQLGRLDLADALVLAGRDAQEDRTRDRLFSEARDVLAAFDSEDDAVRTYTMKSTASLYRFRMHRIEGAQEKALAAIDKAILLFGAEPKYHNERGQLLAQMGPLRRAQAIASFTSDIQGSVIFGWGAEVAADAAWSVAVQDDALLHSMETLATYVLEHDPGFVRWRLRRAYVRLHGKKTAAVVLPDLDAALATTSHRKEGPRVIRQVERLRSRLGNPASNLGVIQSDLKSLLRRIAARVENDKTRPRRQR